GVPRCSSGSRTWSGARGGGLRELGRARGQRAGRGEPWLAAEARDWEGAALYLLQNVDALDVGRDALARYRVLADRDPGVEARMLEHIGSYLLQREEVSDALTSYRQAIDAAGPDVHLRRLGDHLPAPRPA